MHRIRIVIFVPSVFILLSLCCSGPESEMQVLTADLPLHLEEHLDEAKIEGSEVPENVPAPVEWRFNEPQPQWKPVIPTDSSGKAPRTVRTEDALRLYLDEDNAFLQSDGRILLQGSVYTTLPEWNRDDWAYILVQARTSENIEEFMIGFNLSRQPDLWTVRKASFQFDGESIDVINDGKEHTYALRADWSWGSWEGPWDQLGIVVRSREPAHIDILSVKAIPKESIYASSRVGVSTEVRSAEYRRTLYTHVPSSLKYRVRVPEGGRLDVGLGVLRDDSPVTFKIVVKKEVEAVKTLLEETHSDQDRWLQRNIDLSHFAKETITLSIETNGDREGTVALWAAPTLTGARITDKPNVIFYIIDGATRNAMSVYGYNRRNTPNLERLAAEGAVCENAYSNSTWSKPSTPSFMTSLHNSVLGGYSSDTDPLPDEAVTMAQHFHKAGYQTAVFTTNPYAGTMSSLDRGVDTLREAEVEPVSRSSEELHQDFWRWREAYPDGPFWVHFQTMDIHWPRKPVAPTAGLYVKSELRDRYYEWEQKLAEAAGRSWPAWPNARASKEIFDKAGVNRRAFFDVVRGLYDEGMAHNDYQIGRLVERLKETGEWDRTLFIVAADHGETQLAGVIDPFPERWGSCYYSYALGIPMIIVWPGKIAPGQRITQQVSMIDVLPTLLELCGLPMPDVMQGQSMAPLFFEDMGWEPRPVIVDEFYFNRETGNMMGSLDVIDGRWAASLEINPFIQGGDQSTIEKRPSLMLYDLWENPYYGGSVHEDRPDLVKKYTQFLQTSWKSHSELAQRFTSSSDALLNPEQIRALRTLGYIK